MSVKDKVVWITAAAGGIGKAAAELFAKEGAKLCICDIDEGRLAEVKADLEKAGAQVVAVPYDATKTEDMDKVFKALIDTYGTVDVLVNNAGITGPSKSLLEITADEWDTTLEANLRSVFYCMKLAVPYMIKKGGGKVVNISSVSGKNPLINRSPYTASKMGVMGLTRTAAAEFGKHNITVNAICPGPVEGPRLDWVRKSVAEANGSTYEEFMKTAYNNQPLKHDVPPADIAQAILFLSDAERSNSVTGIDMNVACGAVMF